MKPATHTLNDLFGADVRYVVPLYQRPYVWRKASHWEPLWQDVVLILDRHLDSKPVTRGHFLGAVVLEQESTSPGEIERRLVIDGQQRLTTLQLLVAAAAVEVELAGGEKQARLLTRLVRNDPDLAEGIDQLKIWPTNADREAFTEVMGRRPFTGDSTIPKAHEYFAEVVRSWLHAGPAAERLGRCDAMRIVLTELLHVVSINLEPGDDAQVIFETLNARGTPLLAIDLVKNAVFQRLEREHPHSTDKLHHEVWEPELGRSLWREELRQGRLKRPRAELFLMHWLAMKLGEIIGAGELFSTFRDRILNADDAAAEQLITELCADARIMRSFDEFPAASIEGRFFQRLAVLDTTTVLPVLLLLFRDAEIDTERRRRALVALESWLVRRMVCGLSTNGYTNAFTEILAGARETGEAIDKLLIRRLDSWEAPANRWPRDNEVAQVFATRGLYGWIAQRRLVMVLAGVEARRRESSKVESILDPGASLSLEHLLPQSWREHWPLPELDDPESAAAERDRRLNLIGNLTLVTSPLNSSLSNSSWTVKRAAIAAQARSRARSAPSGTHPRPTARFRPGKPSAPRVAGTPGHWPT